MGVFCTCRDNFQEALKQVARYAELETLSAVEKMHMWSVAKTERTTLTLCCI